ncbi:MAG: GNAT family N-acetyltransferase [Planctomycetota bacterium]
MYRKLQDVTLKSGERMELGVLLGPEQGKLAREVRDLLAHKGRIWQWQINQSLDKQFQDAQSRFYIALRDGKPLANVMTVEAFGLGIFGHVFTRPEERRKGLADKIIGSLMADFRARGGKALYLGTGFDSTAYHIYARHGFKSIEPQSGRMAWFAQSRKTLEAEVFAPAPVRRETLSFEHWPTLPALTMVRHPAHLRVATMEIFGPASTEGGALPLLMAMNKETDCSKWEGGRAQVAVSEKSGAPVAIACAMPEHVFWKQVDVLDVFCAPGFEGELQPLAERLQLSAGRAAICYADSLWPARQEVLRALGFRQAAVLPRFFLVRENPHDVELWIR